MDLKKLEHEINDRIRNRPSSKTKFLSVKIYSIKNKYEIELYQEEELVATKLISKNELHNLSPDERNKLVQEMIYNYEERPDRGPGALR